MAYRITEASRQLATDSRGGVAVIVALSLPVILGFSALALEYGSALITRAENQRTSDIAAFAAAHAYNRDPSASAADAAAKSIAALNGVPSDRVSVSFPDKETIDVSISEDKPIYLSRLLRPDDSVTINTLARVRLATTACILALNDDASEGIRVNGSPAGNYKLDGCTIDSNADIVVNGNAPLRTSCSAPNFNRSNACDNQTQKNTPTKDPYDEVTAWPTLNSGPGEAEICDFRGTFPDDLTTEVGNGKGKGKKKGKGKGKGKSFQLREGILCVEKYNDGDTISSNPEGSTLIFKENVNLEMKGNPEFSIKPPDSGPFAGVAIYAPKSKIILRGTPDLLTDNGCRGLVAGSWEFAGNVTIDLNCNEDDPLIEAGGDGPVLVR